MRRNSTDHWCSRCPAAALLLWASAFGCADPEGVLHIALTTLKVVAGLVVVIVVFLPLMASLATIRAAIRRALGSRGRER